MSTSSRARADGATAYLPLTGRTAVLVLAVILTADFMELLDATIVSVAAPAIAEDLGADEAALQWMVAGYTLAVGAGLITGGSLGDRFGRRRMFLLGLAAFALTSAGCGLAPNPGALVALRAAQGLAAGLMIPQVFGIIRASFAPGARAGALGAYGAVLGLASVAGPLLGGILVEADPLGLGWRAIFWVNVPVALAGLALGARLLPESRVPDGDRPDLLGAALASLSTVLLLLPLIQGREWGWPWWGHVLMLLSLPAGALFLVREQRLVARGGQPVLDPALLRVRAFSCGLAVSLLFFGALGSFFLLLSLYLQLGTGRSALETGLVILPYAVGSIATSGVGVQFAHRFGRTLLVTGALLLALSQFLLLLVVSGGSDPSFWALGVPLLVGGLGLGLTAPSLINVILAGVPARGAGAAGGVLTTVTQIGNALGVAVLGAVFFARLERSLTDGAAAPAAYGDALGAILPWQCACYVAAAALMFLLPRRAGAPAH
ncbi:MFS transporter [Nocardiopsis dassonvillei]|uniref:MFS transporter n=1 Tax=Nocardiopsis dassonvillei TaxID=2014 RepID=UPI00201084AE|nr:MFS transporter [Nocardiopsis dassonvillei]MCK9868465.1 MFS transporter [Nocardiopsis dassonvillei]